MRRKRLIFGLSSALIFGFCGVTALASCKGNVATEDMKVIVTGGKNGSIGETCQLSALVIGDDKNEVDWKSSNSNILSVDGNGLVTFKGLGTASITATSKKYNTLSSTPLYLSSFGKGEESKKLEIVSLPTITKYKKGAKLSFNGLEIMGYTYFDNNKAFNTGKAFSLSELKFSTAEGTELKSNGELAITVTADGYSATSFKVSVADVVKEEKLYVTSLPRVTQYQITAEGNPKFSSTGLRVAKITYEDGKKVSQKTVKVGTDYKLSVADDAYLEGEGTHTIEVIPTKDGIEATSFTVIVYTQDLTIYNYIKTLQDTTKTRNYQAEVLNSVGTTNDNTGFHYLRTYTENYYDEISYQNTLNSSTSEIEFTTTNTKSHIGYTSYKNEDGSVGVMQYRQNAIGDIIGSTIVSQGTKSWWDKAGTLANLFTVFDLDHIPTNTLNGKYLVINVNQVEGDDENGKLTIKKYPLIEDFLSYCGWSDSLITVINRFTITLGDDFILSMKASMGQYGSTELKINMIGGAKNVDVENALNEGLAPDTSIDSHVQDIADIIAEDNYTRYEYTSDNGITSRALTYYNPNYYYTVSTNAGYALVKDKIYTFKKGTEGFELGEAVNDSNGSKDIPAYVSKKSDVVGYAAYGLKDILGKHGGTNNLHTFSKFDNFSSGTSVCYQSFDEQSIASFEDWTGGKVGNSRLWFYAHYTNESLTKDSIESLEIWNIAFTGSGGSGSILALGSFGSTNVDWIEEGIAAANSATK